MSEIVEKLIHTLHHSFEDTIKLVPVLFIVFFLMEYFEHKAGDKLTAIMKKIGSSSVSGVLGGAALGCIPQCGFSAAASNLYAGEMISMGALVAVFLSTSDEALPLMLSDPDSVGHIWKLIAAKLVIAIAAGLMIDAVSKLIKSNKAEKSFAEFCSDCGCGEHGIWYSALVHTLSTTLFILIVNLILTGVMEFAGEDMVTEFLSNMGFAQPFVAALVGLIPNCASSVIITQLYINGALSFGSAVAGLSTGAGVGLAVLFKANKNFKENMTILGLMYIIGTVSGVVINLFA